MSFISKWLRSDIQNINAYHVSSSENMIKLDAMESPFSLPPKLVSRYLAYLSAAELNRYPDVNTTELKATLRDLMDIPDGLDMLLGNGSDELIQLLALACDANATILSFKPSFVMYEIIAKLTRLNYQSVPLSDDFEINLKETLAVIRTSAPKLIFIAYPNNPTGNSFDQSAILEIIRTTDALVVLDEAYYAYAEDSFLSYVVDYPNLVLLRTVSKIGFAGLRLGLLIGHTKTIIQLNKLRLPYNINSLTQMSAEFLLKEKTHINQNAQTIISLRTQLINALTLIPQIQVYQSQANFVLFKAAQANDLFIMLKENGVLIKNFHDVPALVDCLRVTVGKKDENKLFINLIKSYYD